MRKVIVTQRFFDEASMEYLRSNHCDVTIAKLPPGKADGEVPEAVLREWLQGAAGWIVGHARVTRDLLLALPDLKIVSRRGVGYERVDVAAVRELGRVATIAAGGNDATVADQTIGMMLALGRRFREGQAGINRGSWAIPLGTDLYRKTVGVIGLGRIGRAVVKRLAAFDCKILVHAPRQDAELAARLGFEYAALDTILAQSDYVTLHAPLTPQTRFLIRQETIRLMKPTAFVINTARGGLVEDRDLLHALENKELAGAGLDVFMSESDPSYQHVTQELASMPNVIAQPHSGASTREGLDRTNMIAARCVVAVLNGMNPPSECIVADGREVRSAVAL
ncbi:phosphoglycerate dehydrogenase [Steroidobacter sp. S1-65]|uniref:Phosphoglycerate dehydrogenase n=1 Tax=Steroidobacter gossypii TaxID=2805490 RepID=A0ABS1X045_9GAMM|nr:phosphoglycerate dehydrogenase [Steroidobacter gossypii]MBM0106600.1 phosphoglycerate dehydrogenase [Steroidobacter gossypii]